MAHVVTDLFRTDLSKCEAQRSKALLTELVQMLCCHCIIPATRDGHNFEHTEAHNTQ
jgi:hypothetical protein